MTMLKADNERKLAARDDPNNKAVPQELEKEYERLSKVRPMVDAERTVRLPVMIDFNFEIKVVHGAWEKQYMNLLDFKVKYGRTRVSRNDKKKILG